MVEFYNDAGVHLPFVSSLHNIWRARRLYQLRFGTAKFEMKDHKEVEKLLDEAGRCSQGEVNYEAGPQSVTQVIWEAKKHYYKDVRITTNNNQNMKVSNYNYLFWYEVYVSGKTDYVC